MTGTSANLDESSDIRPLVAAPRSKRGPWLFGVGLAAAGALLFQALEARRTGITAPSTVAPADTGQGDIGPAPELAIPQEVPIVPQWPAMPQVSPPQPAISAATPLPARTTARGTAPSGNYVPQSSPSFFPRTAPAQVADSNGPGAYVPGTMQSTGFQNPTSAATTDKERVQARKFSNPSTTVPKGTVVQAVLESALDSTRGGFARGIVSRDVYSFDGSRVLIQRGSRILGEYKSDVSLGQSRILIQWQRLMRPDGVMIDLGSPSADPLGRAGIKGSVNTHFFERFAGAILQSSLDVGVQLAARAASHDTVVVALPGGVQQTAQAVQPDKIQPTVKVRQGTSVSVFVAQDLDFTTVEP